MWGLNDVLTYSMAYGMGEEEGRAKAEKEKKKESPWHTGTPTEKGVYLVASEQADGDISYNTAYWAGKYWDLYYPEYDFLVVAWQKIEPYKED